MTRKIDVEALCADKGLRITEQRKVIAKVLGESEDHPDHRMRFTWDCGQFGVPHGKQPLGRWLQGRAQLFGENRMQAHGWKLHSMCPCVKDRFLKIKSLFRVRWCLVSTESKGLSGQECRSM